MEQEQEQEPVPAAPVVRFRPAGITVTIPIEAVDEQGNVLGVVRFEPVTVYHPYPEGLAYCIQVALARAPAEWTGPAR